MWVMFVTFIFYSVPEASNSSVATAEFTSQESCEAARDTYLGQLKDFVSDFNDKAQQRFNQGTLGGPTGIKLTAVCVKK